MNSHLRLLASLAFASFHLFACGQKESAPAPRASSPAPASSRAVPAAQNATSRPAPQAAAQPMQPATQPAPQPASAAAGGKVVGEDGIAGFDALSAPERDKLRALGTLFLHQSVGQDLEDGAESLGFKFNYYGPDHKAGPGLNGGIFVDVKPGLANGNPAEKLAVFRDAVARNKGSLRVAMIKLGYADVRASDLAATQAQYQRIVTEVKSMGLRVVHVTPPLVFDPAENGPKMAMRSWMLSTFTQDVIFDLQDIESKAGGARCEVGGVWRICPAMRSTAACPSKGQGVDGDGAGHLCEKAAGRVAKAMLFAIHRAGQ